MAPYRVPDLEPWCYVREADTDDGREGFALFDASGDLEIFAESEADILAYIREVGLIFLTRH